MYCNFRRTSDFEFLLGVLLRFGVNIFYKLESLKANDLQYTTKTSAKI